MEKVITEMTNDAYHSTDAIGSSGLKLMRQSPLHYWAAYRDPNRAQKDKKAWRIGRAWHCAVFEPADFDTRYATDHGEHASTKRAVLLKQVLAGEIDPAQVRAMPEGLSTTTKEGKALAAEIEAAGQVPVSADDFAFMTEWLPKLAGRDILSADTMSAVHTMAQRMREHPVMRIVFDKYGAHGKSEVSIFDTDPETGVAVKIRPDHMLEPCADFPNGLIIDAKSTTDASSAGFARQLWNLDYGLQAAFYTSVYQRVYGTQGRPAFMWAACEKEAPHASACYSAGRDLLEYWDAKISNLLHLFAECLSTDTWPGYPQIVQPLALPVWAEKQVQEGVAA